MRKSKLLLASLFLTPLAFSIQPKENTSSGDNYWEITVSPDFRGTDNSQLFWRTHKDGGNIEVYKACEPGKPPFGSAKSEADGAWVISDKSGPAFIAKIAKHNSLILQLSNKTVFGSGRRIMPVKCTKEGVPEKIIRIQSEELERSFAAMTGDASHLEVARGVLLPSVRSAIPTVPALPRTSKYLPSGNRIDCDFKQVVKSATRDLGNVPTLGPNPAIWPGALLQGKKYAAGSFAPINMHRNGGTLSLTGVNLTKGAHYSKDVERMSYETVQDAIKNLLSQKAISTESDFALTPAQSIFNNEQLGWELGVDGRFLNGLNSAININSASGNNYVLVKFTQTYYTASVEDPEDAYGFFEDGPDFKDAENQMGADNPPLYIKSVGYGRNVFFLVSSTYDSNAIIQALNAAADGKSDATTTSGGVPVSFSQILQNSAVSYLVQGGDSVPSLGNFGTITGVANVYEAIKKTITDAKLSQVTDFSKGLAVKYSVSYLTDRSTASMGFGAAYNMKSCGEVAKKYASFWINVLHIDDETTIKLLSADGRELETITRGLTQSPSVISLDDWVPKDKLGDSFIVQFTLYNKGGPSGLDFQFGRENYDEHPGVAGLDDKSGAMVDLFIPPINFPGKSFIVANPRAHVTKVNLETGWAIGNRLDYRIRFNRGTGAVNIIQRY